MDPGYLQEKDELLQKYNLKPKIEPFQEQHTADGT